MEGKFVKIKVFWGVTPCRWVVLGASNDRNVLNFRVKLSWTA